MERDKWRRGGRLGCRGSAMYNARPRFYSQGISFSRPGSRPEHREPIRRRLRNGRLPALEYPRTSLLRFETNRPPQRAADLVNLFPGQAIEKRQRQRLTRDMLSDCLLYTSDA